MDNEWAEDLEGFYYMLNCYMIIRKLDSITILFYSFPL